MQAVGSLLASFRAAPLDDLLSALSASLDAQQREIQQLREAQAEQQRAHNAALQHALDMQDVINKELREAQHELREGQRAQREAHESGIRSADAARAEQAEISKRALALQRELIVHQAEDIVALQGRVTELEARLNGTEVEAQKKCNDSLMSKKAQEIDVAEQAERAIEDAKNVHIALKVTLENIETKLCTEQTELANAVSRSKAKDHEGKERIFNASNHLANLLALSASIHNSLTPQLVQYGIHIEFVQRQLNSLQRLHIKNCSNGTETTMVRGLNESLSRIIKDKSTMLASIEKTSAVLNKAFVTFEDLVLDHAHSKTVDYCNTSLVPSIQQNLLERMESLIVAQSENIVKAASTAAGEKSEAQRSRSKRNRNRSRQKSKLKSKGNRMQKYDTCDERQLIVPSSSSSISASSSSTVVISESADTTSGSRSSRSPQQSEDYEIKAHNSDTYALRDGSSANSSGDGSGAVAADDSNEFFSNDFSDSSDSESQHGQNDWESRALLETERLASGLKRLRENISIRIDEAVTNVRSQTTSMQEHVQGIFVRIGNIETRNEVLDNAVAAIRFTQDNMKLWKQDIQTEIEQMRKSIPVEPEPFDDSQLQEQLDDLAKKATTTLLQFESLKSSKDKNEEVVKAALEEQASAIAHLVASKADQTMVEEGLNSKADLALEIGIREFMKKVALDIDDRDYRSGKIASSERAQLETRILRMVTSSLRRIRRQQSMLSKALPQGLGSLHRKPLMASIMYKCLACERPSPPSILDPATQEYLSVMSGGSALIDSHLYEDHSKVLAQDNESKARITQPYGLSTSTGSLSLRRPVTAPHAHGVMHSRSNKISKCDFGFSADPAQQARQNMHTYSPYKVKGAGFRIANKNSR